jgi:Peptidase family M28
MKTPLFPAAIVFAFVFAAPSLIGGHASAEAPQKSAATAALISRMSAEISAARIERNIRKLVSFETRNSLSDTKSETRGIGAARRWIKSELERCAKENSTNGARLKIEFDEHMAQQAVRIPQPTPIVNVVATLPGMQTESVERVYVVSGHYDSMPSSPIDGETTAPGANDDASGTAAVIELACVMSKYQFDATLIFMTVAGEEQGLVGATFFAKAAKAKGMNIAGMITNDIIGNSKGADGTVIRDRMRLFAEGVPPTNPLSDETMTMLRSGGENDFPTRQLGRFIKETAEKHFSDFKVDLIYRRDRYLRGGDHSPFLDAGYPAVRMTEAIEDFRHQHQTPRMENGVQFGDLPEFVDFEYAAKVTRVNAAVLASLALAPAAPREVQMETITLENDSTLRWRANAESDVAGYRIVWRDTSAPFWQHRKDVGNVTRATVKGVSKDNVFFGVEAYDKEGNTSMVTYPVPFRLR